MAHQDARFRKTPIPYIYEVTPRTIPRLPMLHRLRRLSKKSHFEQLCSAAKLQLDYAANKSGLAVLEDIFIQREYADYFPFLQEATVLDVGAHFGYFSLFAAQHLASTSKIYAFEPSRSNVDVLRQNVRSTNFNQIDIRPLAVGPTSGATKLYTGANINHSLYKSYPLLDPQAAATTVDMIDLNSFFSQEKIETLDFLKLDCEGAEYEILASLTSSTLQKIKVISMEFHNLDQPSHTGNALVEFFQARGFTIAKFAYSKTWQNLNFGKLIALNSTE